MTDAPERYGNRRIDRMYRDWSALREAVSANPDEATQAAFDRCEEWVDFAFGKSADLAAAQVAEAVAAERERCALMMNHAARLAALHGNYMEERIYQDAASVIRAGKGEG